MFTYRIPRAVAGAAVALTAALGAALLAAPPAAAATVIGGGTANPSSGSNYTLFDLDTDAMCPEEATHVVTFVKGAGFTAPEGVIVSTLAEKENYSANTIGGFSVPLARHMQDFASMSGFTDLSGRYDFTVHCQDLFGMNSYGDFAISIWFTSPTTFQSSDPTAVNDTTTALSLSAAGPVDQGTAVTLTADITPAGASGTVQFRDNGDALGSPVNVSGGRAELTTSNLDAGTHALTAEFTPSTTSYRASSSTPRTLQVNSVPATPTTTALAVSPADSAAQHSPVTLTAAVTPAGAAGTVKFQDTAGGTTTTLGTVNVSGGQAVLTTSALAVGDHALSAVFTPSSGAYLGSDAGPVSFGVTPFQGVSAGENITTTVESGALAISVENPNVTLPAPVLNSDATLLTTAGPINAVTLTDTRAGNPGWSLSGQVTDFTDGGSHVINGQNLGWTPKVIDKAAGQTATPGAVVAPAAGVEASDPGTAGLKSSRSLAVGTGLGTAHFGADLALNVPTSTVAGTYTATLTLTAI
ncbi:Ig-like domain-containing protein [Streptomyces polyrhachis]|uniref:Ig-like domain-containing protein n=1 Tax=Streptomyces polyrhachis TaxID=1282885 RepID=A0ABW2GGK1_9ACTN